MKTRSKAELMLLSWISPAVSQPDIHLVSSHMFRLQTGFVWPVMPQQISFGSNPQNLHSWHSAAHKMLIIPLFFPFLEKSEWLDIFFGINQIKLLTLHWNSQCRQPKAALLTRGVLGQSIFCHTSTPKCVHDKRLPSTYPTLLCKVPHARRG